MIAGQEISTFYNEEVALEREIQLEKLYLKGSYDAGFDEFAWDPENSSRDVQFSADFRHLFLCESNYYFRTVVGNRPFSDGVHYWEIVADSRTEHELKVGVTTQ